MKKNLGMLDRMIRLFLGIAAICVGIAITEYPVWAIVLGILGLLLIFESFAGFCWLYHWFNIDTAKKRKKKH